jgi:hypothetical protein
MSEIIFSGEKNETKSNDIVALDMDLISSLDNVFSTPSKTNYLLSPDNRRKQLLSKLQLMLCERSSKDQPEPILTKEKFIQLFQSNACYTIFFQLLILLCVLPHLTLYCVIGSASFVFPAARLSIRREIDSRPFN